MSAVADQRKRPSNQSRSNVASQSVSQPSTPQHQQKKSMSVPANNSSNGNNNSSKSTTATPNTVRTASKATASQGAKSTTPPVPQADAHVPLKGFNPVEIDRLLRSGCSDNAEHYKPSKPSVQKTGPWGQKLGHTAAGKDFWVELRKQVGHLQKGEPSGKGG